MNLLLVAGALAALFGLWMVICKLDGISSLPQLIAAVLMMFGVVMLLGLGLGARSISPQLLITSISCLLFGVAIWLAYDRRER
jgi:glycerol-3-phosphate acyltransferase PlsY